jgi:hypothetical protein
VSAEEDTEAKEAAGDASEQDVVAVEDLGRRVSLVNMVAII